MSDSGGPEDPEVKKLRQQLAAAERAADLRAQLVEARKEVAEVSKLLGENNPVRNNREITTGALLEVLGKYPLRNNREMPTGALLKLCIIASALTIAAVFFAVTYWTLPNDPPEATKPSLVLECPKIAVSDLELSATIKIGAKWVPGEGADIKAFWIRYGDGSADSTSARTNSSIRELLEHSYERPHKGKRYSVYAKLMDDFGRIAEDTCSLKVPRYRNRTTPTTSA